MEDTKEVWVFRCYITYLNTFKYQPVEELQNENTAGEKDSIALAINYLKPENKIHPPFFMHDMAGGSFLFSPAVRRWCQRQAGPLSFLTACCAPGGGQTDCTVCHPLPRSWLAAAQQGMP